MPRMQRDRHNPAQQRPLPNPTHIPTTPEPTEDVNPFTDSSFLVTPTIGHSAFAARNANSATPAQTGPNSPDQRGEIADETGTDAASPWATRTLPPFEDPTLLPTLNATPTAPNTASATMPPGVSRSARPTGAPQRDSQHNTHAAAQRALVRAIADDERQLATQRTGEATPAVIIQGAKKLPRTFAPVVPRRRGPTSFLAQFIVTMVTTVILFSVVTLATPLGQSAVFGNSFQTYANVIPIIPTATPTSPPTATPLPVGYNPGATVIMNMISSVFGGYSAGALAVARCESGYDPNAWNPYPIGNSHASGVFQILYPSTWDTTSYSGYSPYDANANIHAAYEIFSRDGYSWREWQCQP